jgi:hypothetical protein
MDVPRFASDNRPATSDMVREAARNQGEHVAQVATWLRLGRLEWERSQRT